MLTNHKPLTLEPATITQYVVLALTHVFLTTVDTKNSRVTPRSLDLGNYGTILHEGQTEIVVSTVSLCI